MVLLDDFGKDIFLCATQESRKQLKMIPKNFIEESSVKLIERYTMDLANAIGTGKPNANSGFSHLVLFINENVSLNVI